MNINDDEPRYVISVAARMVGVQVHTLRYYERVGIVEPSRSSGNIRLYSEREVAMLRRMKNLINDLGVNMAGVEVVMRMSKRLQELYQRVEELEAELRRVKGGSGL